MSKDINKNIETLKGIFKDCDDISYRAIEIGGTQKKPRLILYTMMV